MVMRCATYKRIRNIEWAKTSRKKQKLLSDSVVGHRNDSANERKRGWRGAHKKLLYQINIIIRYKYKAPIYSTIEHREKIGSKCMGWKHHRNITTHSPSLCEHSVSVFISLFRYAPVPDRKKLHPTKTRAFCFEQNALPPLRHSYGKFIHMYFIWLLRAHNLGTDSCHRIQCEWDDVYRITSEQADDRRNVKNGTKKKY